VPRSLPSKPNSGPGTRTSRGFAERWPTLLKVMLDQGTPASTRIRAAECVMNHSSKAIEI
jgi:hypothetical protein